MPKEFYEITEKKIIGIKEFGRIFIFLIDFLSMNSRLMIEQKGSWVMNLTDQYLIFILDEQRYAMGLSRVEKVIRAVEMNILPEGQDIILGLINMQGKIIPVINIRKHFYLPSSELKISNRIIISNTSKLTVAFVVDTVEGVVEIPKERVNEAQKIFPKLEQYIEGVGKLNEDTVLIYNVENLLSTQDVNKLKDVVEEFN
jgi:purine-binding chemotaxis protein CheW